MAPSPSSDSNSQVQIQPRSLGGFWALIAVQFQGAFSDNALKWLVSFLVLDAAISKERRDLWFVLVVPLLFAVPFLLFSIPGGYLADRYSKRSVTLWTKVFELGVMGLATYALASNRLEIAGIALFLACTQGAIFGPTKYGLLPELLPLAKLSWGNGIIELGTLLAAISAALAGGFLAQTFHGRQVWSGVIFLALTVLGLLTSFGISKVPAADRARRFAWNVPAEFFHEIRRMRSDSTLWTAVVANTFFWFLGSLLLLNIVLYATDILHVDDAHSSYLLAALSLGIGIGSFVAGLASGRKIEPGMVLPGLGGILLMSALLSRPGISYSVVLAQLALLGMAGGFFVVPVNALIQQRPRPEEKGRAIAVANLLSFVGVALQPLAQYAMLRLGHPDPSRVFLIAAAMTLLMGVVLARMLPELWPRALDWTRLRSRATL
ncbi:MAG TPA: MFS transporter [Verrucomicrobiae bacterium]|jgi:acyl-[acyl-carrier-protein]-phospholipid O-acyltransferase/long-chain-fatty-acid--[acyl-carrier-protein] ligase|nr:MFS transporter [Verrucomicrobiae bacterium]